MNKQDTFFILAVNPGSTSTKVAIYQNEELLTVKTVHHSKTELECPATGENAAYLCAESVGRRWNIPLQTKRRRRERRIDRTH